VLICGWGVRGVVVVRVVWHCHWQLESQIPECKDVTVEQSDDGFEV